MSRLRIAAGTVCAVAALGAVSPAPAGATSPREPRLYSTVVPRGRDFARVFKVRPSTVAMTCADGGTLMLAWRRWTRNSASGSGWTAPCEGAGQPVTVFASRPVDGYFTRMSVRYDGGEPNRLGLGHAGGRLAWIAVRRLTTPGSGASPWPR